MTTAPTTPTRGFSLVEVVIALGVAAFCLLTLMGLLAVGINGSSMSAQQSVAVNIATAVATDLRATPLTSQNYTGSTYKLFSPRFGIAVPAPTTKNGMQSFYVSVDGTPLTQVYPTTTSMPPAGTAYRVTLQGPLRPTGTAQRTASPVFILVTWPGLADQDETVWPSHFTGSFQTTVYVDQN